MSRAGLGRGLALAGVLASLQAGCAAMPWPNSAPRISIDNRSGRTLNALEISGQGFRQFLGRLGPAERRSLQVRPSGESGVRLRFRAGRRWIDTGEQGYIEPRGGYLLDLTVTPALTVRVDGRLRNY